MKHRNTTLNERMSSKFVIYNQNIFIYLFYLSIYEKNVSKRKANKNSCNVLDINEF